MRGVIYFAAAATVALTAFWAYRVNYAAQEALGRVQAARAAIAAEREALAILRADWAWLNGPERLARLAAANAGALGLVPLAGERFADVSEVPEPPPDVFWARADPSVFLPAPSPGPEVASR